MCIHDPNLTPLLCLPRRSFCVSVSSLDEMSRRAVRSPLSLFDGSLPLCRRLRVFWLRPLFYQFTSVIPYTSTMSSHSNHRDLLGSQRDMNIYFLSQHPQFTSLYTRSQKQLNSFLFLTQYSLCLRRNDFMF